MYIPSFFYHRFFDVGTYSMKCYKKVVTSFVDIALCVPILRKSLDRRLPSLQLEATSNPQLSLSPYTQCHVEKACNNI